MLKSSATINNKSIIAFIVWVKAVSRLESLNRSLLLFLDPNLMP